MTEHPAPIPVVTEPPGDRCMPFQMEGGDETVILVHGFTGCPGHYRLLAPVLAAAGYRVVIPLLAGHCAGPEDLAASDRRKWLASVIGAAAVGAGTQRLHLVGLSMGGLLALIAAPRTAAATITTINSPIRFRDRLIPLSPLLAPIIPKVARTEHPRPRLDPGLEDLWLSYPWLPTASVAEMYRTSRQALRVARRLRRPATVIQSRADETVDPASGRILAGALGPQAQLHWLDHSIHNALIGEERDRVADLVLEALRQDRRAHDGESGTLAR